MEQLEVFKFQALVLRGLLEGDVKKAIAMAVCAREERFINWMSMTSAEQVRNVKIMPSAHRRKIMKQNNLVGKPEEEEETQVPKGIFSAKQ